MSLAFGLTVLPDPAYLRQIVLLTLGEQHGFGRLGLDSNGVLAKARTRDRIR